MDCRNDIPWAEINELILNCGEAKTPHELSANMFEHIDLIVPFDQGRIYTLNPNEEVSADTLFGVDKRWPRMYYDYYSQILDGRYSLQRNMHKNGRVIASHAKICVYDWSAISDDEFIADYIRPQRIRHSVGFGLYDMRFVCKRVCIIDRTRHGGFSKPELDVLGVIVSHLENLHRNFYIDADRECSVGRPGMDETLTARENEIADMICKGYAPEKIADILFVSRATVYKHIAHIHTKIGVSSRQELIVKLLRCG
jgi:DNA-binding CsgD family transcriptional regulator